MATFSACRTAGSVCAPLQPLAASEQVTMTVGSCCWFMVLMAPSAVTVSGLATNMPVQSICPVVSMSWPDWLESRPRYCTSLIGGAPSR